MKKTIFGLLVAVLGAVIGAGAQFYYGLMKPPATNTAGGPPAAAGSGANPGAQKSASPDGAKPTPAAGAAPSASASPEAKPSAEKSASAGPSASGGVTPASGPPPGGAGSAGGAGASKAAAGGPGGGGGGGGPGGSSPVEISPIEVLAWPRSVTSVGALRSDESVTLRSEVTGRIQSINFRDGQRVARGQVMIKLDDTVLRAELEQARANQRLAKAKFDRAAELKERGFISGQAKDEAENAQRVADAAVQLVEARLARLTINAPFTGTAGLRVVGVGDYLREGQDVVTLEKTDIIKVDFKVPEVFLSVAKPGQALQIALDALPKQTFTGVVSAISPQLDAAGRAVILRAQLNNRDGSLKPGMFARVRLLLSENAEALTIPEQSLAPQGDEQFVFRVVEGRAARTKVEIGQRRDGRVEIVTGLDRADRVVSAGWQRLRDGSSVRPVGAGGPPGSGGGPGKGGGEGKGGAPAEKSGDAKTAGKPGDAKAPPAADVQSAKPAKPQ